MAKFLVRFRDGRTITLDTDDPVQARQLDVYKRNMRTAGPINAMMGQDKNTPVSVTGRGFSHRRTHG